MLTTRLVIVFHILTVFNVAASLQTIIQIVMHVLHSFLHIVINQCNNGSKVPYRQKNVVNYIFLCVYDRPFD